MKPIENIFGFDCVTCEHNRHCYGGNMGNQFRYCQKSIEKVQNLDKLEQENKKYKEVIEKAINNSQYWIDYYTRLNSDERIALRLQENIDILKEVE